jgi:hypothetical protein
MHAFANESMLLYTTAVYIVAAADLPCCLRCVLLLHQPSQQVKPSTAQPEVTSRPPVEVQISKAPVQEVQPLTGDTTVPKLLKVPHICMHQTTVLHVLYLLCHSSKLLTKCTLLYCLLLLCVDYYTLQLPLTSSFTPTVVQALLAMIVLCITVIGLYKLSAL